MVVVSSESGEPTRYRQALEREAELKRGVRSDPLVQAVLSRFPGAEIVAVTAPDAMASIDGTSDETSDDVPPDELPAGDATDD
jgi:DNA polymerase-3 subunit gamma/tau